jgi:hypothetical protein
MRQQTTTPLAMGDLLPFLQALPWPKTITRDELKPAKPRAQPLPMRRIRAPSWAPAYARGEIELKGISQEEYESLHRRRPEILALLDAEVDRYVKVLQQTGHPNNAAADLFPLEP